MSQEVTKPIALDETLQATNTALGLLGKDTTLQSIVTALAGIGVNTVGNLASLVTTDKTSLVGAVNEVAGDISDLDTDKADKVDSAIAGNLASLDASGNLADSGWKSDKTTTAVSGNPINITGLKTNQLAKDPIITFEPIQAGSGTPSPSNVRTISGYDKIEVLSCGVNVWNEHTELGLYDVNTGLPITSTGNLRSKSNEPIIVKGNETYYWKQTYNGVVFFYDNADNFISNYTIPSGGNTTFTTPSNAKYVRFHLTTNYGTTYKNDVSINYPSTVHDYVPYDKTTDLSLTLGQTVYGGTLDVETGVLTVDRKIDDLNNYIWNNQGGIIYRATTIPGDAYFTSDYSGTAGVIAEQYKDGSWGNIYDAGKDGIICMRHVGDNDNRFVLSNSTGTIAGKFVYRLATPFTIQLTPHEISLLKDYAYVSTNGTSIALDYHNGELASLGDVSQLGETVNELGKMVIRHKQVKLSSSVIGTSFSPTSIRIDKLGNLFGADCANQNNILSISVMQINVTPASMFICGYYNDYLWIASNQSCTLTGDAVFNITYIANQ